MLEIVFVLICFIIAIKVIRNTTQTYGNKVGYQLLWVYFIHILISIIYVYITTTDRGNDSLRYWNTGRVINLNEALQYIISGRSTNFMFGLMYFFANFLNLSYITCTLIFSTLGFIAIKIFFIIAYNLVPYNSSFLKVRLFPLLFLLPNLHFWSVGVGKDTLVFLAVALFFYGMIDVRKRAAWTVVSIVIFALVRAHVLMMLVVGFAITVLIKRKLNSFYKVLISLIFVAGIIVLLPKVMEIANIDEVSVEDYSNFASHKAEALSRSHTGSAVDISSYPLPIKILTYLYRPTFIDINGIPALLAAFENLLLLILSIKIFRSKVSETYRNAPFIIQGMLWYTLISAVLFSMSLGNLGIMLRMRNMILPCMIIYILWNMSYSYSSKLKTNEK
ncbi:hypothetical protein [Sphingobacterium sp.]|uniref:hypothetical protein n=1 Tax=Sphingobacterium sp. TaxID=341027 RepID=UPI00289D02E6|nr:hypothetical protein [Sphingobacterium sp.]